MARGLGLEPRLTASKAAVLPLDDLPIFYSILHKFPDCPNILAEAAIPSCVSI